MSAIDNKWEILSDEEKAKAFVDLAHYAAGRDTECEYLRGVLSKIAEALVKANTDPEYDEEFIEAVEHILIEFGREYGDASTER